MLTAHEEASRLYQLCGEDYLRVLIMVENQLNVIYTRAQVLVGISGMVITVTGFSGKHIADTSELARNLIVVGLGVVLSATIWVFLRVMTIRWATANLLDDGLLSIERLIVYRNRKTAAYQIGGKILACGLVCYGIAVSLMLFA